MRYLAYALAIGFVNSTDVPAVPRFFLVVFGAVLPMTLIEWSATRAANFVAEWRARRLLRPRPVIAYLLLALGWALTAGAGALLAWVAGARPDGPGLRADWIATFLVWVTAIGVSGTLVMTGRALSAATARGRGRLARRRAGWKNASGPHAHPGATGAGLAGRPAADPDRAPVLAGLGRPLGLLLRERERESARPPQDAAGAAAAGGN